MNWTLWLHGPIASGKSTIAKELFKKLSGYNMVLFDGDFLRQIVGSRSEFSREDRNKQAHIYVDLRNNAEYKNNNIILCTNSHFEDNRNIFRNGIDNLIEVYVSCPLEVRLQRDYKGLYRLAQEGLIEHIPDIDDILEEPSKYDIKLDTNLMSVDECVEEIIKCIKERFYT